MRSIHIFILALCFLAKPLSAQENIDSVLIAQVQKKDTIPTWELGIHAGHIFSVGNVDYLPGLGLGLTFRRALDYVFSIRGDVFYGNIRGEDIGNVRNFSTDWLSTSILCVVTLNNMKWERKEERKSNFYILGGIGANYFEVNYEDEAAPSTGIGSKVGYHGEVGAGFSFRIGQKANLGLEHKALIAFGDRADLIDGFRTPVTTNTRRTYSDVLQYSDIHLNLNFNKNDKEPEPKYWLNPMDGIYAEIDEIKEKLVQMEDSDGDGVIDFVDKEANTPKGAIVDTKGVTKDGDLDGIPDFRDREPYSPPGFPIDAYGVAKQTVKRVEEDVRAIVKDEISKIEFPKPPAPIIETKTSNWYLPNIYFEAGSTEISSMDHGTLLTISEVMKENPDEQFLVVGHTDKAGSESANNRLSYKRASSVVNQLVQFGVPRDRLVLKWKGERSTLVNGLHEVNRRVEIRLAKGEMEMLPPEGIK